MGIRQHAQTSTPRFLGLLGKAVAINVLVAIFEENRLSTMAALRHVKRAVGNDDASETSHARAIA